VKLLHLLCNNVVDVDVNDDDDDNNDDDEVRRMVIMTMTINDDHYDISIRFI